jgi:hypothetical protein
MKKICLHFLALLLVLASGSPVFAADAVKAGGFVELTVTGTHKKAYDSVVTHIAESLAMIHE